MKFSIDSEQALSSAGDEIFVMPCTTGQKRFWMLEQISPGNTALNIPIAVQLRGPLRIEVLEQALNALVARHEILRTRFALVDGEPKQMIRAEAKPQLHRVDAGWVPPDQRADHIRKTMREEATRPLPLDQSPLLRATLLQLSSAENVLMLTAHHIISDGWSNGILVRELGLFYEAFLQGKPASLQPLTIQYADYSLWQEEWLKSPDFKGQLDFWKETLAGDLPALDFPTDFVRQNTQTTEAALESLLLSESLGDALKAFCAESGVTLFMIFFSAYCVLLHRYTGQNRLILGTTAGNRNRPELEELIGLFANILILHCDLSGGMPFREFLLLHRDQSLGSFAHQEVPFETILELLPKRKGASQPLLQTHFLFQKAFMQPAHRGGLEIRPLHSLSPGSTFELTFGIVERHEGINLQMEYRTSLFKRATIQRMLKHFQALLQSIVAHPETPIDELSLFAEREHEELERTFCKGSADNQTASKTEEILKNLDRQLESHAQKEMAESFTPAVALPQGSQLMALDDQMRLLPIGIPGSIFLNAPAGSGTLPGQELVLGPQDTAVPIALLKTEFIGRNAEGESVELWGRKRDLIRFPVFRFNLRTVEIQLSQHPAVGDAAVVVRTSSAEPSRLIAYAVLRPGIRVGGDVLRTFLKGRVSDLALPAVILIVPEIPRDASGTVLVDLLPLPPTAARPSPSDHVPMQGILHQQLAEIWSEILGVSDIGLEDNFFEIGGTSLLAWRMMMQVEKLCRKPMPLTLLLKGATIANLARFIIEANPELESATRLIPLQTQGKRPPLFFLHGDWAGGGFYCHRLSQQLGQEQPFYVLPPFRTLDPDYLKLRKIAAYHCAAMRKEKPQGPYVLGGYCIGATIAIEIAQQLIAEGETVSHLFLVDPPLWGGSELNWAWPGLDRIGKARGLNLEQRIDLFDRTVVAPIRWLKMPWAQKWDVLGRHLGGTPHESSDLQTEAKAEFRDEDMLEGLDYSIYFLAYRLYRLQRLSVPATLYLPATTPADRIARVESASKMDPRKYQIEILPGSHTTCVTKYTSVLAEKMAAVLSAL